MFHTELKSNSDTAMNTLSQRYLAVILSHPGHDPSSLSSSRSLFNTTDSQLMKTVRRFGVHVPAVAAYKVKLSVSFLRATMVTFINEVHCSEPILEVLDNWKMLLIPISPLDEIKSLKLTH